MSGKAPLPFDVKWAAILAWLRANKLEAHTDRSGQTLIHRRLPKVSRSGQPR